MRSEQDSEFGAAVARILAATPSFKVGDRVRVTGGIAKCEYCSEEQPGKIGRVFAIDPVAWLPDNRMHGVWIRFEGGPVNGSSISHFAPTELELLP